MSASEAFFRTHPVFTHEEYAQSRAGASARTADSLLRKHVASGRIARVRRGLYVAPSPGSAAEAVDPFLLATKAAPGAAVSHHAALQYHGRAYSVWSQVTFLSPVATRPFRFGPIDYVPVRPPEALRERPDLGVALQPSGARVCSLERALVDILHDPTLGGGWEEIFRSLAMVEFFDLEAVVAHTLALGSAITAARVGFFLARDRERLFVEERHLASLAAHAPRQARYLDASRAPGRLVAPWNVIVPEHVLATRWEESA
jgi:predicted transcriptional regulator of viral defense system